MKTKHPHADLIVEFYTNFIIDSDEYKNWQFRIELSDTWEDCQFSPNFHKKHSYRRKPKPIKIGKFNVPEPLRVAPEIGTRYWFPSIVLNESVTFLWENNNQEVRLLNNGLCHLNEEAAELHCKALLSFTELKSINLDLVGIE